MINLNERSSGLWKGWVNKASHKLMSSIQCAHLLLSAPNDVISGLNNVYRRMTIYGQWTGLVSHSMSLVKSCPNPGHEYCVRVRAITIFWSAELQLCVYYGDITKSLTYLHLMNTSYQQAALPGVWWPLARQKIIIYCDTRHRPRSTC